MIVFIVFKLQKYLFANLPNLTEHFLAFDIRPMVKFEDGSVRHVNFYETMLQVTDLKMTFIH